MQIFCNNCGHQNIDRATFCQRCDSELISTTSCENLAVGTLFDNRYEIKRCIKSVGMHIVYEAVDTKINERCTIKEMSCHYTSQGKQDYAVERFALEAKLLAGLRHVNLPRAVDYFHCQGKYYTVMNFIEGEDLETILQREGKEGLAEKRVIEYSVQILDVLSYLHSQKLPIIYRDLKPPNIMIQNEGKKVMLINFGLAIIVRPDSITKASSVGTEGYVAPEQYVGKPEPRSDIYSLGATMYHLLTGMKPAIPFHFTPVNKINPLISNKITDIVMKALQIKPEDRFISADEMKKMLHYMG